jgi:hypothetical protein
MVTNSYNLAETTALILINLNANLALMFALLQVLKCILELMQLEIRGSTTGRSLSGLASIA